MKRNTLPKPVPAEPEGLSRNHVRRLRQYYRSAGWPCQDNIELDLLERGFVRRECVAGGQLESIVVTDAGIGLLARQLERNRNAHAEHEALVERVARWLLSQKRLVFRGVALRTRLDDDWALSKPDVFSLRHVTSSRRLHPTVHEIKVRRADLLGDLKNESKRRGYQSYSQSFHYVIAEGIAEPDEVPADCGLIVASARGLRIVRPAPYRPATLTTAQWVALARAGAEFGDDDDPQFSF
jgi:hypothetical protein